MRMLKIALAGALSLLLVSAPGLALAQAGSTLDVIDAAGATKHMAAILDSNSHVITGAFLADPSGLVITPAKDGSVTETHAAAGSNGSKVESVQGCTGCKAVPVTVPTTGYGAPTTITRPANATAYTALDVVGGALDLGVMGPSGGEVMITSAALELDVSAIPSGMTSFRLYLYGVTPPSATADNSAWDLPSGDRASYLGYVDLGVPVDLGSTLYVETNGVNKQVTLSGTHVFGYLVTIGGYTPAANSEVYKVTLHTQAL